MVQAADFFDDWEGLLAAIEEIADRLFIPERATSRNFVEHDGVLLPQVRPLCAPSTHNCRCYFMRLTSAVTLLISDS